MTVAKPCVALQWNLRMTVAKPCVALQAYPLGLPPSWARRSDADELAEQQLKQYQVGGSANVLARS